MLRRFGAINNQWVVQKLQQDAMAIGQVGSPTRGGRRSAIYAVDLNYYPIGRCRARQWETRRKLKKNGHTPLAYALAHCRWGLRNVVGLSDVAYRWVRDGLGVRS